MIYGSDFRMNELQPTKAARPHEAMCDRLVLLLLLLLLLLLPLLPALPLVLLCCYRYRTDNVRREPVSVFSRGVGLLYTFCFYLRTRTSYVRTLSRYTRVNQVLYIPVPVYDARYQVLDKHAPRIPAPNISCCSIIVAFAVAFAAVLTLQ